MTRYERNSLQEGPGSVHLGVNSRSILLQTGIATCLATVLLGLIRELRFLPTVQQNADKDKQIKYTEFPVKNVTKSVKT